MDEKDEIPTLKEFLTSYMLPDLLENLFQIYLIIDKIFGINFFGKLSWWQVFIPFYVVFAFTVFFYDSNEK